jgi:DNA-binding CsgD family transcriptional regulator
MTMKTPGITAWYAVNETRSHPLDSLNRSELKVMEQLSVDASNEEIAQRLYVSEKAVRNHVLRILEKLELQHRRDAARMARQNGLRAA